MSQLVGIQVNVELAKLTDAQIQGLAKEIEAKLKPIKVDLDIDGDSLKTIQKFNQSMEDLAGTADKAGKSVQNSMKTGNNTQKVQKEIEGITSSYQRMYDTMNQRQQASEFETPHQTEELRNLMELYPKVRSEMSTFNEEGIETQRVFKLMDEQLQNTATATMDFADGSFSRKQTLEQKKINDDLRKVADEREKVYAQLDKIERAGYGDKKQISLFKSEADARGEVDTLRNLSKEIGVYNSSLTDLTKKKDLEDTMRSMQYLHSTGAQRLPRANMLADLRKELQSVSTTAGIDKVDKDLKKLQKTMSGRYPLEVRVQKLKADDIIPASELHKVTEQMRKAVTPAKIQDISRGDLANLERQNKVAKDNLASIQSLTTAQTTLENRLKRAHSTQKITTDQFNRMNEALKNVKRSSEITKIGQDLFDKSLSSETKARTAELQAFIDKARQAAEFNLKRLDSQTYGKISPEHRESLESDLRGLRSITVETENARRKVGEFQTSIRQTTTEVKDADQGMARFGAQMQSAFLRIPIYAAGMAVLGAPLRAFRDAMSQIIELDAQMTVLTRVSDGTIGINQALEDSVRIAEKLGNTIHDVNEGLIAFSRQGFRGDDLSAITEVATVMSNVSDLNVEDASSALTAAMKGFNIEAQDSIRIVDALNEVNVNQPPHTEMCVINGVYR